MTPHENAIHLIAQFNSKKKALKFAKQQLYYSKCYDQPPFSIDIEYWESVVIELLKM